MGCLRYYDPILQRDGLSPSDRHWVARNFGSQQLSRFATTCCLEPIQRNISRRDQVEVLYGKVAQIIIFPQSIPPV
jgi:hypothetical protein